MRKNSVDIDVLRITRNEDRKIMKSVRIVSRPPAREGGGSRFT